VSPPVVSISIDTEEDNWGSYSWEDATTRNIQELPRVQELFDRFGARPTYLVNYPPLVDAQSVRVLGELAARKDVELAAHCHPWNTPPRTADGVQDSMMCRFSEAVNRRKITAVRDRMKQELGVTPTSFRAGRWGLGATVTTALHHSGFEVDCSVSPLIDWTPAGGPDHRCAPVVPYRFSPERPLSPDPEGAMVEMPTTIGFFGRHHARKARRRRELESSELVRRLKVVGALDRAGLLTMRWLSPEASSGADMVRLVDGCLTAPARDFLQVTFHSSTLLPGATPFAPDGDARRRFLENLAQVLTHLADSGARFRTLREASRELPALTPGTES
jgi:hypothetical protein